MKRIFALPVILLCAFAAVTFSCGTPEKEETCDTFGQDVVQGDCIIPGNANICCTETSCTLTINGKDYTCSKPKMEDCINEWVNQICPTTKGADRDLIIATLRAMTTKLLNEARANSVCR